MKLTSKVLVIVCLLVYCYPTTAAIVQFNDRATWSGMAGAISASEDFNGFVVDTSIAGGLGLAGGMVITEVGEPSIDLNIVDVTDFVFGGALSFDGTPYLAGETDFDIDPAGVTEVVITFATPVSAWGAEIVGGDGVEALMVSAKGGGGSLGVLDPVSDNTFLGFIADAGEQVSSLRFFAGLDAGASREAFGMDDIAIVNVPEPSTALLLLLSSLAGLRLINKR